MTKSKGTVEIAGGRLAPQQEEKQEEKLKVVTVHIPLEVWKKLMLLKVDGKVKSLNSAVVNAINLYVGKAK